MDEIVIGHFSVAMIWAKKLKKRVLVLEATVMDFHRTIQALMILSDCLKFQTEIQMEDILVTVILVRTER